MPSVFAVESPTVTTLRALNYSPVLETFRRPHGGRKSLRLGDLVSSIGAAYGSMFTRIDCDPSHGVELLSQTDMFAAEPTGRVIRVDSMSRPERHRIDRWQVLIAGAGTLGETELFGRSIIADDRLVGKYVSQHSLVLAFSEPGSVQNLYAYAFLCSGLGVSLTRSTSYGTKIMGLRKDSIANLHIPDADQSIKDRVAELIRSAVEQRGQYVTEMRKAREAIGQIPEIQAALRECSERKARCTIASGPFSTIAARNHASLGPVQSDLNRTWTTRLSELLEQNGIYKGPRFSRVPCKQPHGIQFFDQRDIFAIRPVPRRIVAPSVPRHQLYVPPHGLIVASRGQFSEGSLFGHVETASFGLHRHGITEDILRIIPKEEHHDFLYAYLSSTIGFMLLKSTAVGTSIPMMHPELIARIPCPPISSSTRATLAKHVQGGVAARKRSESSEAEAVRIIEQEVLPSWLA